MDRADDLRAGLERLKAAELDEATGPSLGDSRERERIFIARWLRQEFSDEPAEDTQTLSLFPDRRAH
jgi:hypothetical protein